MKGSSIVALIPFALIFAAGCEQRQAASVPAPSPFLLTASIQDVMQSEVDPSADYLWDIVSTVSSEAGVVQHQPRTDEEWMEARHKAIVLVEATNLLVMEGRHVAEEGKKLEDEGKPGILTAAQIQKLIDDDHASFVSYAHGLHEAGVQALRAIDAKDANALLEAGGVIDAACEACHVKYWYPNQQIPDAAK